MTDGSLPTIAPRTYAVRTTGFRTPTMAIRLFRLNLTNEWLAHATLKKGPKTKPLLCQIVMTNKLASQGIN